MTDKVPCKLAGLSSLLRAKNKFKQNSPFTRFLEEVYERFKTTFNTKENGEKPV